MPPGALPEPPESRLAATLSDLRCAVRRDGAKAVGNRLLDRAKHAAYERENVVVLYKDLDEITPMSGEEALRVEDLEPRHLPALYEFNRRRCFSKANARTADRLRRGYQGFVGFVGDKLVGYYWWVDRAIEPHHPDIARYDLALELADDELYGFDFYLLEEHRGRGNAMEFLFKVEQAMAAKGYRRVWGYVVADNRPARWLYGLRGYRSVRSIGAKRVLSRRFDATVVAE